VFAAVVNDDGAVVNPDEDDAVAFEKTDRAEA